MCIDEAEKLGAPLQVSHAAREFLAFAISQGDGDKDNVYTIRHFENGPVCSSVLNQNVKPRSIEPPFQSQSLSVDNIIWRIEPCPK